MDLKLALSKIKHRVARCLREYWTTVQEGAPFIRVTSLAPMLDELERFRTELEQIEATIKDREILPRYRAFLLLLNKDIDQLYQLSCVPPADGDHQVRFQCLTDDEVRGHVGFLMGYVFDEDDEAFGSNAV